MRVPRPDARAVAVVAALAAVSLLATLIVWRRQDLLGVVLAMLCVLLAIISVVSATAARDAANREPAGPTPTAGQPDDGLYGVDADTLETLDQGVTVRAVRDRHRGRSRSATGEGR